jgi:Ca2+/Na+ antiporter
MSLPANIRINMGAPFPALVKGSAPIAISKVAGIWNVLLSYLGFAPANAVPNPASSVVLVQDQLTGVFYALPLSQVFASKVVKTLTAAGPYAALPTDEVLIVKQLVAAPFVITVDWSQRTKPLRDCRR